LITARLVVKTSSLSLFWQGDVTLPYSGNIACGGSSFVVNVSIDINSNLVIKNAVTGTTIIPSTLFPQGSQVTFSINGQAYTLFNLADNASFDTDEGFSADVGVKTGFPQGNWDQVNWDQFNWG
jgi:hypothetical protein